MKICINLLPESRKLIMARKKRFRGVLKQEILFLLPLLIFILMLVGINFILKIQNSGSIGVFGMSTANTGSENVKNPYEGEVREISEKIIKIKKFKENHLKWSNAIDEMLAIAPEGISISEISTQEYQINLLGKASNREALVTFKEKLVSGGCFEEIDFPFSNLVEKDNVDFQVSFKVKRECLIKK